MSDENPGFMVKDGILIGEPRNGSNLFTEAWYGNFILRFEYLLSSVGNSGVLIRSDPANAWQSGVEIQLLAPWTPYRDDLHCTASIYGHVAVTYRPDETTGIWHQMEIRCDRKRIEISVDDRVALTVDTDTVDSMIEKNLQGAIGFQSNHSKAGEFIHLKNIVLKNLDSDPDYVANGFLDEDARVRKQAHDAAVAMGSSMFDHIVRYLAGADVMARAGAKQVLFDITARVTAPGIEPEALAMWRKALTTELRTNSLPWVKDYLIWLLDMSGSVSSVPD